jgi:protein TonB
MLPSDISFKANPAERWLRSRKSFALAEPGVYVTLFGVGLVYAIMLSLLFFEGWLQPAVAPETIEIPVEIVAEPPPQEKPPDPAPKTEPPPAAQPVTEEPAFDAPRAANNEKRETETFDEPSKVAGAPPPSPDPNPERTVEPRQEGKPRAAEKSADPVLEKPAAEAPPTTESADEKSSQSQARADAEAQSEKPKTSTDFQFPTFESVPDVDFESAAKQTPVAGGAAKATYLSILYGMIMPHMHSPPGSHSKKFEGTIVFSVDGTGNLMQRQVVRASGSHDLDAAALEAIRQAAPFPPPPRGAPLGMRFTYVAN